MSGVSISVGPGEVVSVIGPNGAGKKIDYVGAAGIIDFNQWHNSGGGFQIDSYQANGDLSLVTSITAAQLAPLIR